MGGGRGGHGHREKLPQDKKVQRFLMRFIVSDPLQLTDCVHSYPAVNEAKILVSSIYHRESVHTQAVVGHMTDDTCLVPSTLW